MWQASGIPAPGKALCQYCRTASPPYAASTPGGSGLITQKDPPWWALPTRPLWKRMGNPRKVGKVILLACSALSLSHTKPYSSHNFLYFKKKLSVLYSSLILSDIMTEQNMWQIYKSSHLLLNVNMNTEGRAGSVHQYFSSFKEGTKPV